MQINLPSECPECGSEDLQLVKDLLYCRNKSCSAQSGAKLSKFCKTLKIKGFGPATVEKSGISSIEELVKLTPEFLKNKGFSDKMADKLTEAVSSRLKSNITMSDFLAAVSIPNIGAGTAKKLSHLSVDGMTFKGLKSAGLGDVAANSLTTWIQTEWPSIETLGLPIVSSVEPKELPKLFSVCITGKLDDFKSRTEAADYLKTHGIEVKKSITKEVSYLICEDGKTTSSSYKKAIATGLPVTTIKKLLEEI